MSHFVVLVIGDNVEKQLAPFHEFESTGTVDEYVQNVDVLEEARRGYAGETITRLRAPDGVLHDPYGDAFYRDPTPEEKKLLGTAYETGTSHGLIYENRDWKDGLGFRMKVLFVPEGYVEVEVPRPEVGTFAEYITDRHVFKVVPYGEEPDMEKTHKFGWVRVDASGEIVEAVDRTNPNAEWDWWVVGGRWTGYFTLTEGAGKADTCRWGDVDVEAMKAEAATKARELFAYWRTCFETHGRPESWETVRDRLGVVAGRDVYWKQPAIAAYREAHPWDKPDALGFDEDVYATRMARQAIATFAILMDGEWIKRGSMGRWGVVYDEKDSDAWLDTVEKILSTLDADTQVTAVDCHI